MVVVLRQQQLRLLLPLQRQLLLLTAVMHGALEVAELQHRLKQLLVVVLAEVAGQPRANSAQWPLHGQSAATKELSPSSRSCRWQQVESSPPHLSMRLQRMLRTSSSSRCRT